MSVFENEMAAVAAERQKIYGNTTLFHENIGLSWTALIQQHYGIRLDHPLPAWLVEQMMVAFKIQRAARVYHHDNYVDAANYLKFAEEDQGHSARLDALVKESLEVAKERAKAGL